MKRHGHGRYENGYRWCDVADENEQPVFAGSADEPRWFGTSWVPDETPMYAYMIHGKKWMTMIHGSFFLRYNKQDLFNSGSRGGKKLTPRTG